MSGDETMNTLTKIAFAMAATMSAAPAMAATLVGTTADGATFNRPVSMGDGAPITLSSTGTAVRYQATSFTVAATGSYSFLMTGLDPLAWDTYLGLYANSFSAASALANALVYNDDFPSIGLSGFTRTLTAGTTYIALATGFSNTAAGRYSLAVTGPGAVSFGTAAVPEPATWAMMLVGFAMMGAAVRYRRRNTRAVLA